MTCIRYMCGMIGTVVLSAAGASAENTVDADVSSYTNLSGYLEYTAGQADETVRFNGGDPIVWGETFLQNRATFNPVDASGVLTVLNPLVMTRQTNFSRIKVERGVVVFPGGVSCQGTFKWDDECRKTGYGTAKFTGAFNIGSDAPVFRNDEGTSVFSGADVTHTLKDMYVGSSYTDSRVIFDNTAVSFTAGCHIGCEDGVTARVYSTNSTVTVQVNKDFNIGNNGGDALYMMKGGSLEVGHDLLLGRKAGASAVFTNDGGKVSVGYRLCVGADAGVSGGFSAGGDSTLVIDGGGEMKLNGNVCMAAGSGSATVAIPHGKMTVSSGDVYFGYNADCLSRSVLHIGASGSFAMTHSSGTLSFGHESGNLARVELDGGSFSSACGAMLGRRGVFRGEMSGGTASIEGGEFSLGRFAPGSGRLDMFGGTFTAKGWSKNAIGWGRALNPGVVTGIVSVAGDATFSAPRGISLAEGGGEAATAYGEINLSGNGTFETTAIASSSAYGSRRITADGGTFRVLGSAQTLTYLDSVNLETYVGRRGVTFDTRDNIATVVGFAADGKSPGQIRKTGSGTLILGTLPQTHGGVAVQEGALKLAVGATVGAAYAPDTGKVEAEGNAYPADATGALASANYLLHRWSFTGRSRYDSVAAVKAEAHGDIDVDVVGDKENLFETPDGSGNATFLDLGSGLFGAEEGDFTVEFWACRKGDRDGKLLVIGMKNDSSTELYINNYGQTWSRVGGDGGHASVTSIQMGKPELDKMYHYSIVFRHRADGRYDTTIRRKDPETGDTHGNAVSFEGASFSPVANADSFCLGATPAHDDKTVPLEIDEVRIWKAALSDAQLAKNALLGPDELPLLNMDGSSGPLHVTSGATFDLGGNDISYGALAGGGTVTGGTLAVEKIEVDGAMRLDADVTVTRELVFGEGDSIVTSGTLDISGATIRYTDPVVSGRQVLVSVTGEGRITGSAVPKFDQDRGVIKATASEISVVKPGFVLTVR